jgi:regulator of protease activity HflC (stomatin/prohibitin superfamily)
MKFRKRFSVAPNMMGYLFKANQFVQTLKSGIYTFWDLSDEFYCYTLPSISQMKPIVNQEVLTKDNIALRFSYTIIYRIINGEVLLNQVEVYHALYRLEERLHFITQLAVRDKIAALSSEELNMKRAELTDCKTDAMEKAAMELGVTLESVQLRDLTFPKFIQDLFAKELESKIRAKSDLENARTAVATARALKNASELMKDDDNIRFMQFIEMMTKIAEKGKHTFVIGEVNSTLKK